MSVQKLTEEDFMRVADDLKVEVAAIKAVQKVETGGRGGFFAPDKPAILFEGHIFWSQLKKAGIDPEQFVAGNEDILYPKWTKEHYKGGIREYERLEKAEKIHRAAALSSASWGMFQIMGFNYSVCGYSNVEEFVEAMVKSEGTQLEAFAGFLKGNKWVVYLKEKDWCGFAKRYNGPRYEENRYHIKLATAYEEFLRS